MHGMPIPPYRVRTNTGSGFLAIRLAILSCRNDSVRSRGSMSGVWGKHKVDDGAEPLPLCAAIASLECNTSGLFYKGFPRVGWLQVRCSPNDPHMVNTVLALNIEEREFLKQYLDTQQVHLQHTTLQ